MVNARLHIICGNCGCNDNLKLKVDEIDKFDSDSEFTRGIVNCDDCKKAKATGRYYYPFLGGFWKNQCDACVKGGFQAYEPINSIENST